MLLICQPSLVSFFGSPASSQFQRQGASPPVTNNARLHRTARAVPQQSVLPRGDGRHAMTHPKLDDRVRLSSQFPQLVTVFVDERAAKQTIADSVPAVWCACLPRTLALVTAVSRPGRVGRTP